MATQEGANVAVYAVRGNFDDAQTGVKKVFGDTALSLIHISTSTGRSSWKAQAVRSFMALMITKCTPS